MTIDSETGDYIEGRWQRILDSYSTLKEKLDTYSKESEAKDKLLLDSFKVVLKRQEETAKRLSKRNLPVPEEPSQKEDDYYTILERRKNRKKLLENKDLYAENRY